jgi:hypothetical protein
MTHRSFVRSVAVVTTLTALAPACTGAIDTGGDAVADTEAALTDTQCPPSVPEKLVVPDGNRLGFAYDAAGEQLYVCRATSSGFAWQFLAPDADLFKQQNGNIAGAHYAGPTWEALDGSTVVAARVDGFTADPTAVAWLLLAAVSHGGVDGRMSKVSYIQRLDTVGGIAPTSGCDAGHVDEVAGVAYTATYYFYVPADGEAKGHVCEP